MKQKMPSAPSVSVVMPVYNAERHVAGAIDSIIAQTFGDFEFVIVNDGSTDGTATVLSAYSRRDERLRVVTRENRGLPASLNEAISMARGKWIARMDADDVALPDRLAKQLAWLEHTGADVCGGWARLIGIHTLRTYRYPAEDDAIKLQLCFQTPFAHPTVVMRAALAKQFRYSEAARHAEDYDLWARLAVADARMTNLQERVMLYRVHPAQASQVHNSRQVSSRETAQRLYVGRMVGRLGAFDVMRKFATPLDAPTEDDAKVLMDIILSIPWASSRAKLHCYATALRYVRPSSPLIYVLHERMRRQLFLDLRNSSVTLFVQSMLRLSSDSPAYNFLKRLV